MLWMRMDVKTAATQSHAQGKSNGVACGVMASDKGNADLTDDHVSWQRQPRSVADAQELRHDGHVPLGGSCAAIPGNAVVGELRKQLGKLSQHGGPGTCGC